MYNVCIMYLMRVIQPFWGTDSVVKNFLITTLQFFNHVRCELNQICIEQSSRQLIQSKIYTFIVNYLLQSLIQIPNNDIFIA